jgi:hypothetical protein
LLERDIFDLFLPKFDKPWVIHLRETCCCSTNLSTWRPNTVYKNRSVRRHQSAWEHGRGLVASMEYPIPPSSHEANGEEAKNGDDNNYEDVE